MTLAPIIAATARPRGKRGIEIRTYVIVKTRTARIIPDLLGPHPLTVGRSASCSSTDRGPRGLQARASRGCVSPTDVVGYTIRVDGQRIVPAPSAVTRRQGNV